MRAIRKNPLTATSGAGALVAAGVEIASALASGNGGSLEWPRLIGEILLGVGLIFARDHNRSSEDQGIVGRIGQ